MTEPYNIVVMDPPWKENGGGRIKRGADRHYPTMSTKAIIELLTNDCEPLTRLADNAIVFCWVTNNFLPDGLKVIDALGLKYITNLVWVKAGRIGMGQYFRGQHELCLMARKKPQPYPEGTYTTIIGGEALPRRAHSQKPDELQEMIEARWDGPYLELFARRARDGWDAWGNEVNE